MAKLLLVELDIVRHTVLAAIVDGTKLEDARFEGSVAADAAGTTGFLELFGRISQSRLVDGKC